MPTRKTSASQTLEPTHTTTPPHLPITPPPQCIDLDALKASILAGLICDTTNFRTMPRTTPMMTTQPMTTMQPTKTPENTNTTDNKMPSDPAHLTGNVPTLRQPQQLSQTTTNGADAAADNFQQR